MEYPATSSLSFFWFIVFATSLFPAFGARYLVTNFWFEFFGDSKLPLGFPCSWD